MSLDAHRSWNRILHALLHAPDPLHLHELAARVDLHPSTLHRHLAAMADAGWVVREGHRKEARYAAQPRLEVQWVEAPSRTGHSRTRHNWAWRSSVPVDWRFPLVQRVPDEMAQALLLRFLSAAQATGRLTPWLTTQTDRKGRSKSQAEGRDRYLRALADPADPTALVFAVFGSCATGRAQEGSDLDLLILGMHGPEHDWHPVIEELRFDDLAWDLSVGAPRPIQLHLFEQTEFTRPSNTRLRQSILADAVTIYTTTGEGPFLEDLQDGSDGR